MTTVEVPAFISYDLLFESIQKKLETGNIGCDTEYLADLIVTLESKIRLTHEMKQALEEKELSVVED